MYDSDYRRMGCFYLKGLCKVLQSNSLCLGLRLRLPLLCVAALVGLLGCSSGGATLDANRASEGAQLFGAASGGSANTPSTGWRIVLATFRNTDAVTRAQAALPQIQAQAGLSGAFIVPQRHGAVIAVGSYDSPSDRTAQRDLKHIHAIRINGVAVFGSALLTPPPSGVSGANPELNLANAHDLFGDDVVYTLQVAVYESDNRAEVLRSAEQAAAMFRQDGELAFYYHGPNRSIVTIGLFTEKDYDPARSRLSDELKSLMERHPNHLYNGMGVREHLADGTTRNQPTRLVRIP